MSRSAALANQVWVDARKDNDFATFLPVLRKNLDLRKRYIDCFEVEGRAVRHRPRRLRARHEDGGSPAHLRLPEGAPGAARQGGRGARRQRRQAARVLRSRPRRRSSSRSSRRSASPTTRGGSTRRCIRSHRARASPTSASRRATSRTTSTASSGRCTSSATASTSTRSTRRSSAPRSRAASRSACTSRRAACGRTSSAARCRSGATSSRALQELFPTRSPATTPSRWYREVNAVEPSLIRVEADEATYNLHIILRFELEQAMLADEFPLEQLPEEWNRRMWEYLGIEVPTDTEGVLQDVHWSGGSIGYFPTYALGNLISAQIWEKITADLPDLDERLRAGRVRRRSATGSASICTGTVASSRPARRSSASSARRDRPRAVRALPAQQARGHLRHRRHRRVVRVAAWRKHALGSTDSAASAATSSARRRSATATSRSSRSTTSAT